MQLSIEADNHQCKNAAIRLKDQEPDWNFLGTIRLKRNAINYRGILLTHPEWKFFDLPSELHIDRADKEIELLLTEFKS